MRIFFLISGIVLILSGTLQAFIRPRNASDPVWSRVLNRATIRALVFVMVGVVGILFGMGVLSLPQPPN